MPTLPRRKLDPPTVPARRALAAQDAPEYVMTDGSVTLSWGWLGHGFQPVRLVAGDNVQSFAACPVWAVELTPGFEVLTEGTTLVEPSDIGNENVSVEQDSGSSWTVRWSTEDLTVAFGVAIVDDVVRWSFDLERNESRQRARALIGPSLRLAAPGADMAILRWLYCGSLHRNPAEGLFVPEQQAGDINLTPDITDSAFPELTGISMDSPGLSIVDCFGWISESGREWTAYYSTDDEGICKRYLQLSDGTDLTFSTRHYIRGEAGNTGTIPYEICLQAGTSSRPAGAQWMDICEAYRAHVEAMDPCPEWWRPVGWGAGERTADALFSMAQYLDVWTQNEVTLAAIPTAGATQVSVSPTGGGWTNDPLTDSESAELYVRIEGGSGLASLQIRGVAAGAGDERVLTIEPWPSGASGFTASVTAQIVRSTARILESPEFADKVVQAITSAAETLDLRPSQILWHGTLGNWGRIAARNGEGGLIPPYWAMAGHAESLQDLNDRLAELGVMRVGYTIAHETADVSDEISCGIRRIGVRGPGDLSQSGSPLPLVGWATAGYGYLTTPENELVEAEVTARIDSAIQKGLVDGLYMDGCLGRDMRSVAEYVGVERDDRGDPSAYVKTRGWLEALRERSRGIDRSTYLLAEDGAEAASIEVEEGVFLTDSPQLDSISDGDGNGLTAEVLALVEAEPGKTIALTGWRAPLEVEADLEIHPGYQLDESGVPDTFTLADSDFSALEDGDGNDIAMGDEIACPGRFTMTTENAVLMGAPTSLGMTAVKHSYPLVFGFVPLPQANMAVFGGRLPTYDITDKWHRNAVQGEFFERFTLWWWWQAFASGIMPSGVSGAPQLQLIFEQAGWSTDAADLGPSDVVTVGFVKHQIDWDKVEKVRRYRRTHGRFAGVPYGQGFASEAWARGDTSSYTTALDVATWRIDGEGLMVAVANVGTVAETCDCVLRADEGWPELMAEGAHLYEMSQDGTETSVGHVSGGELELAAALGAGEIRIYEVR
jgi:hypothetical protein